MSILLFILVCYGLTQILVYGSIFDKVRPQHKFFHCAMCMGFWVGIVVHNMMWALEGMQGAGIIEHLLKSFMMGCVSSGTSYALCCIISDSGINILRRG